MSMFQNLKQKITLRQATRRTPSLLQIDKERERVNDSAAAQEAKRQSLGEDDAPSEQPASAADTIEWHDDKRDERADRFVTTVEGDLDTFGRPMRQGS